MYQFDFWNLSSEYFPADMLTVGQVGFTTGKLPANMRLQALTAQAPAALDIRWTPCMAGVSASVCFESRDYHAVGNSSLPSMASDQKCISVQVLEDPAPFFEVSASQVQPAVLTIGKVGSFRVTAADYNCADVLTLGVTPNGEPLPGDAVMSKQSSYAATTGCIAVTREVTWTPSYKYGGYKKHICFQAVDLGGTCGHSRPQTAEHCVPVEVRRCIYAMQYDQQLQHVAAAYGTDWMRLWSVNPEVMHPDYVPFVGQTITIGHLLRMDSENEMPASIARRMGMSLQQLKDLNYDVDTTHPLRRGQMLCVIPDSCKGMAKSVEGDINYIQKGMIANSWDLASASQPAHTGTHSIPCWSRTWHLVASPPLFGLELKPLELSNERVGLRMLCKCSRRRMHVPIRPTFMTAITCHASLNMLTL
jgi:hypothetical protein